ncbi:MAG: pyridoxine 5'-phosphate synthase [Deltaproteobacteria bacterium]|nr:pyridoxine 5'-phosphate synthase [Deltaproteobacteria bacterium]MBW2050951.1 pyridoxine 5'-phosphate synthase [Deltaproteobacteria bacterium]MBW2139622.1 pyridoxine 5'-phosphate synthase [Deltaproteobacteria bacterium]MBW2322266.1 pyridoxine 5'-phosphate synthase [Deltaproteobacteria bacterium]
MAILSVNVDHIATLRQARGGKEPDPVTAAAMAELAGADGIIVHLREDRRHIQDRDVRLLRETIKTKLNLEMAATEEMLGIAREILPEMSTLVPEKREELTTEGGLNVAVQEKEIARAVTALQEAGILVSLFIDADSRQVEAAKAAGADFVEIHTGHYADAETEDEANRLFTGISEAIKLAAALGLRVNAGHGLNYTNIKRFVGLEAEVEEYSIGHSILSRAVLVGIDQAVREMADLVRFL